jgi:hypothetical protein
MPRFWPSTSGEGRLGIGFPGTRARLVTAGDGPGYWPVKRSQSGGPAGARGCVQRRQKRAAMGRKARLDLVLDCAEPQALEGFWRAALGYQLFLSIDTHVILVPDDDTSASPLVLQQVPEPKLGKNRMHLDLVTDDINGEVDRLVGLGARRAHEGVQSIGEVRWVTMTDPVGNEFCVCIGVEW